MCQVYMLVRVLSVCILYNYYSTQVYTVNQESKYLLVQNVHALGVTKELLELFSLYGDVAE